MAKRKRLKNVQISTEELKPTTIGYLNSKQKGSFLLIIIFAALFVTLRYMSDITEFIQKIINPTMYAEIQESKKTLNDDNTGVIEELSASTHFNIAGVKFTNFAVKDNQITFTVDDSASNGSFSDYYLETYDRGNNLLERILIPSTSINSLKLNYSNVRLLSISHYANNSYPNVTLKDSTLTCTNNDETYKYEFVTGGVNKISYTITMKETDDNQEEYSEELSRYQNDYYSDELPGIERYLSTSEGEFTYTKSVDLLVATTNDLENGYAYNTKSNQIAFEMSTKGYKCN